MHHHWCGLVQSTGSWWNSREQLWVPLPRPPFLRVHRVFMQQNFGPRLGEPHLSASFEFFYVRSNYSVYYIYRWDFLKKIILILRIFFIFPHLSGPNDMVNFVLSSMARKWVFFFFFFSQVIKYLVQTWNPASRIHSAMQQLGVSENNKRRLEIDVVA
jgi:hypothetical protein